MIGRRFDPVAVTSVVELVAYLESLRTVLLCPSESVAAAAREAVERAGVSGLFDVRVGDALPAGSTTVYLVRNIGPFGGPR